MDFRGFSLGFWKLLESIQVYQGVKKHPKVEPSAEGGIKASTLWNCLFFKKLISEQFWLVCISALDAVDAASDFLMRVGKKTVRVLQYVCWPVN